MKYIRSAIARLRGDQPSPPAEGQAYLWPQARERITDATQEMTPIRVASALQEAQSGKLGALQEIYAVAIATDTHLLACVNQLEDSICSLPLRVSPADPSVPEAVEAASLVRELFMMNNAESGESMRTLVRQKARARVTGIRVHSNDWLIGQSPTFGAVNYIARRRLVSPTSYAFDTRGESEEEDRYGELMIITKDEPNGIRAGDFPRGYLSLTTDGQADGWQDFSGVARTCLMWYLLKNYNARWWAELNEIYGQPFRIGYYNEWDEEDQVAALQRVIEQAGRSASMLLPSSAEVMVKELTMSGSIKTYSDLISLANNEISKAVVGQIGTLGREKFGSYGETGKLADVKYSITEAVSGLIEDSFQTDSLTMCRVNMGEDFPAIWAPKVGVRVPNPEQLETKLKVVDGARKFLRIPVAWAHDELGVPVAGDDEDVLPGFNESSGPGDDEGEGDDDEGEFPGQDSFSLPSPSRDAEASASRAIEALTSLDPSLETSASEAILESLQKMIRVANRR